ncbi:glycosyl hydrolase family 61-domain-containing protein [Xylaria grammica]|nr:glycosyl hydrolase family 61-domain-containing protein [Xylaria grammica]
MKTLYPLATLLAAASSPVSAHWVYSQLIVNGTFAGEPYQYIRPPQNGNNFLSDVNSTDMRCNVGGSSGLTNNTETLAVRAGDALGFGIGSTFGHPGIQQVYLSRAPDLPPSSSNSSASAAALYDGSGGWARIYSLTTTPTLPNGTGTADGKNSFAEAQPGAVDWATHKRGGAQFYVACAQIRVEEGGTADSRSRGGSNDSGTALGPLVSIPGVYRGDEPGVLIPQFWSGLPRYTTPGPALWPPGTREAHVAEHL